MVALGSAAQDKGLQVGQRSGLAGRRVAAGIATPVLAVIDQLRARCGANNYESRWLCRELRADWQWVIPLPENIDIESPGRCCVVVSRSLNHC